jgi:hypothetical protein
MRAESGRESESGCTVQLFYYKKTISSCGRYMGRANWAIEIFPEPNSANTGMNITYTDLYLKNIKDSER